MFEVGKKYTYDCSVVVTVFKDEAGNDVDCRDKCVLIHGDKAVTLIPGIWEPTRGSVCECLKLNPLTFACEPVCLLQLSKEYLNWVTVVRYGFKALGITLSENEAATLTDMWKWYFEVQGKAEDAQVFIDFLMSELNNEYLTSYSGSYNGALPHESECKLIFNLIFGIKNTPVIMHIVDKYAKCEAKIIGNKIELFVEGVPYDTYCAQVLQMTTREGKVSDLLEQAEG